MWAAKSLGLLRALPNASVSLRRGLNVHEHVAFQLMQENGVAVPAFGLATSPGEAVAAARKLKEQRGCQKVVLKAQVLAGGRGKGTWKNGMPGGVKVVSHGEVEATAKNMIGHTLVTKQTGAKGLPCSKILVVEPTIPKKETYLAILMEREYNGPVCVYSPMGGMDIEEVAEKHPAQIFKVPVDIMEGMDQAAAEKVVRDLGVKKEFLPDAASTVLNLYKMFCNLDLSMVEINPFAEIETGKWLCLDSKLKFDDDASFRQKKIFALRDLSQEDPKEVEAAQYNLQYVALEGTIGCLVNGAGLAMATMDIIKLHGGEPANFLDVGGSASEEQVTEAFKIITADKSVKAILVNIFGGIMRCDVIARGIISAAKTLHLKIPVVVRLQGTNVEEGRKLLSESGLNIRAQNDFDQAAKEAVLLAAGKTLDGDSTLRIRIFTKEKA